MLLSGADVDPSEVLILVLALLLAWGIDLCFGEPRDALHPVAWLGRLARPLGLRLRAGRPAMALAGGAVAWLSMALAIGGGAWMLQVAVCRWPMVVAAPVMALLLKPMFAWRMLRDEVAAVESALLADDLAAARERLARLVSRDVSGFSPQELRETAIETLSENLNDSVVAPLFWYVVAGLPGAAVYRLANTLDAMWGYRGPWEWAGKWAAIADDVLGWLPARLTALLLCPTLLPAGWRALYRQARRTPSPNGGWPMGAMALRLRVRLGKPGVYLLNDRAAPPRARHMALALRHASAAAWGGLGLAVLGCAWRAL